MCVRAIVPCAVLLLVANGFAGEPEAADLKAMQGTWKVEKFSYSGKEVPGQTTDQMRVEIAAKAMKVYIGDKLAGEATFQKLDAAKNPKEIDVLALTGPSKGKTD